MENKDIPRRAPVQEVFPKEIKIAGYRIKIQEDPNMLSEYACYGEYSPTSQVIRLDVRLTYQQRQETLIHEILEAINAIYDLDLKHDEQLCKLSVALHQILTDNQELLAYFINSIK